MRKKATNTAISELRSAIIEALQSRKGHDIIDINLSGMKDLFFDHFLVCHGDSTTQVTALSEAVESTIRDRFNLKVHHREGFQQAQWILLDYRDIVVHIFLKPVRDFYNLEGLWADASFERFPE
jgi:ribosome-associated protein